MTEPAQVHYSIDPYVSGTAYDGPETMSPLTLDAAATDADFATAVYTPGSQTRIALDTLYPERTEASPVINVKKQPGVAADWNGTTGTDNTAAFATALALVPAGGTLDVPPGRYYFADNFPQVTLPIEMAGHASGLAANTIGTQFIFAAGKSGPAVPQSAAAAGGYWHDIEVSSLSTTAGSDVGFFFGGGYITAKRLIANSFGSHGFHFKAGVGIGGGNINNSIGERLRAYANRGEGIRVEGSDANAVLLIKPDVVANYSWGIDTAGSSACTIFAAHADQTYNGSPGAFRDAGNSNNWDWPYSEGGAQFLIDTGSSNGRLSISAYGAPALNWTSIGLTYSWNINRAPSGVKHRLLLSELTSGSKQWAFIPGQVGVGTLDLYQSTDGFPIFSIDGAATRIQWYLDHRPSTDAARSLGSGSLRWLNGFFSSYVRVGAVATGSRPAASTAGAGAHMFDSTLGKPIWSNGTNWVDATGTVV